MMFGVVLVLGWAMLSAAKASQFTIPTCSCTDFVNDAGFGNCNGHSKFSKVSFRACFVKLPSNCADLVDSDSNPGKKISAQACKERKQYRQPIKVGKPTPEIHDLMQGDDPGVYDQQGECPRNIMVTSTGKAKKWKEKLGKFNLIHYDESGNAVYEHAIKKGKFFLHQIVNTSTWILGNKLKVNYGWIGNSPCDSKCPNQCEKKTWQFWEKDKKGKEKWKFDPTIEIADLNQRSSFLSDQSDNKRRCCKAYTAKCLSCSTGRSENEICRKQPNVVGCEVDGYKPVITNKKEACDNMYLKGYKGRQDTSKCKKLCDEKVQCKFFFIDDDNWCYMYTSCITKSTPSFAGSVFEKQGVLFKKRELNHCDPLKDKYGNFPTLKSAQSACISDTNCDAVYDEHCDNKGEFYLCPTTTSLQSSQHSCVYEKEDRRVSNVDNVMPNDQPVVKEVVKAPKSGSGEWSTFGPGIRPCLRPSESVTQSKSIEGKDLVGGKTLGLDDCKTLCSKTTACNAVAWRASDKKCHLKSKPNACSDKGCPWNHRWGNDEDWSWYWMTCKGDDM